MKQERNRNACLVRVFALLGAVGLAALAYGYALRHIEARVTRRLVLHNAARNFKG